MSTRTAEELFDIAVETACEAVSAREAVLDLRKAADSMVGEPPENDAEIRQVAKAYGIPVRHRQLRHVTLNLADVLLAEISGTDQRESRTARIFAPERDLCAWETRGVLPAGAYHEAACGIALSRDRSAPADEIDLQFERCEIACAFPAALVGRIARAAVNGDTTPMLGAYTR